MILRLLLATLFLVWSGCSSLNVKSDYDPQFDFSTMKHFAIIYPHNGAITLTQDRIAKTLSNTMRAKGYLLTDPDHADFYIIFHTDVISKKQIVTDYQTVGLYPYYYGYGSANRLIPVEHEYTYDEAKIIIDALDPNGNKIFWRGVATDKLRDFKTPQERITYIMKWYTLSCNHSHLFKCKVKKRCMNLHTNLDCII